MKINNIEDIYNSYNYFLDFSILPFFLIIILFFGYKLLNYFSFRYKNIEKEEIKKINKKENEVQDLLKQLLDLKKDINNLNKSDFYNKLNLLFRDYLVILGFKEATKMSLKELSQTDIKKDIFNMYKKGYYYEFNNLKDDIDLRNEIIEDFIYIIKG